MWGQGRTSNSDYGKFVFNPPQRNRAAAGIYSSSNNSATNGYQNYHTGGLNMQGAPGQNFYGSSTGIVPHNQQQGNRLAPAQGVQMMNQGVSGYNWNQGQSGDQLPVKVELGEEAAAAALGMPLQQFQAQNGTPSVNYGTPMPPMKEVHVMQQQPEAYSTPGSKGDQNDDGATGASIEIDSNPNMGLAEQHTQQQQNEPTMQQQNDMKQQAMQQHQMQNQIQHQAMHQQRMQQGIPQSSMRQQAPRNQMMSMGGQMNQYNPQNPMMNQGGMHGNSRMPMMMQRNPQGVPGSGNTMVVPTLNQDVFRLCGKCPKCKQLKNTGVGIQNQQLMTFPTRPVLALGGVGPRMSQGNIPRQAKQIQSHITTKPAVSNIKF